MLNKILEAYPQEKFLKADGFDAAIIGCEENSTRLIYSIKKCIHILTEDMTEEDALEHFSFNVQGSYMGPNTPIWCEDNF